MSKFKVRLTEEKAEKIAELEKEIERIKNEYNVRRIEKTVYISEDQAETVLYNGLFEVDLIDIVESPGYEQVDEDYEIPMKIKVEVIVGED